MKSSDSLKVSSGEATATKSADDAAEKCRQPPDRKLRRPRAADARPAAHVNDRGERERGGHDPGNVPAREEVGDGRRVGHGLVVGRDSRLRAHSVAGAARAVRGLSIAVDCASRSVVRRRLVGRMQRFKKTDQRLDLRGRKVLAVSGHVAAAGDDFEAHLVDGHARGHVVERGTALAARSADGVAVAALLGLEDDRALPHQRRGGIASSATGMGSPLHALMCGLHGVVVPKCVSTPQQTAMVETASTATGRRCQLFSPSACEEGQRQQNGDGREAARSG